MYSKKVKDFAKACGEAANKPTFMSPQKIDFLLKMIEDEFAEFRQAKNEVEQADALVDIIYYVVHAAVKNGYDLDPIFDIVHDANMSKIVDGKVLRREDGKILKPKGWQAPEPLIAEEIARQMKSDHFSLGSTKKT